jgi:hypothetical protein
LGASKLIQFKDNLACNGLLATELQRLEWSQTELGFPHNFYSARDDS